MQFQRLKRRQGLSATLGRRQGYQQHWIVVDLMPLHMQTEILRRCDDVVEKLSKRQRQ
jgi:hypothetical protein